jgi:hypothetical protein
MTLLHFHLLLVHIILLTNIVLLVVYSRGYWSVWRPRWIYCSRQDIWNTTNKRHWERRLAHNVSITEMTEVVSFWFLVPPPPTPREPSDKRWDCLCICDHPNYTVGDRQPYNLLSPEIVVGWNLQMYYTANKHIRKFANSQILSVRITWYPQW